MEREHGRASYSPRLPSDSPSCEMRREMAEKWRLLDYPVRFDAVALAPDEIQHLYDIIEMALRIDPAREGQPHQFVRRRYLAAAGRGFAEHDAAKLDRANAAFEIKRVDEPDSGIIARASNAGRTPPRR